MPHRPPVSPWSWGPEEVAPPGLAAFGAAWTERARPGPAEQQVFDTYRSATSRTMWPRLALLVIAATLVWWPLDFVHFADPGTRRAFALFRVGVVAPNLVLVLLTPRIRRLYPHRFVLVGLLVVVAVGWSGICMAWAGQGDPGWFAFLYLAPFFTVPLLAPLPTRLAAAAVVSTAGWLGFHLAVPTSGTDVFLAASQLVFTTIVAVAVGHWLYEALETQFVMRMRLGAQREALGALTEELQARVAEQTADLLALSQRAQRARTEERRRVARDLHDVLGQELTALALLIGTFEHEEPGRWDPTRFRAVVDRARESLRGVLDDLQPRLLDELGLEDALRELVRELCEASGLAWEVEIAPVEGPLQQSHAVALFRVVQEAMSNVLRHADARSVRLTIGQDDDRLLLTLADDGRGFAHGAGAGRGLGSIRARCEGLGGEVTWSNHAGTTLRVALPLEGS